MKLDFLTDLKRFFDLNSLMEKDIYTFFKTIFQEV